MEAINNVIANLNAVKTLKAAKELKTVEEILAKSEQVGEEIDIYTCELRRAKELLGKACERIGSIVNEYSDYQMEQLGAFVRVCIDKNYRKHLAKHALIGGIAGGSVGLLVTLIRKAMK